MDYQWNFDRLADDARFMDSRPEIMVALKRVARLNPDAGEIGAGMLSTIINDARAALAKINGESK